MWKRTKRGQHDDERKATSRRERVILVKCKVMIIREVPLARKRELCWIEVVQWHKNVSSILVSYYEVILFKYQLFSIRICMIFLSQNPARVTWIRSRFLPHISFKIHHSWTILSPNTLYYKFRHCN